MQNGNCNLIFSKIKDISGTNPYLLSHVRHAECKVEYESTVNDLVQLQINLKGLKADPTLLGDYLLKKNVLKCWKFAYYACRAEILDEDEVAKYWLHQHYITVLLKLMY